MFLVLSYVLLENVPVFAPESFPYLRLMKNSYRLYPITMKTGYTYSHLVILSLAH